MEKHNITIVEEIKELLSDYKNRIKLDDFVTKHLRTFLEATSLDNFPVKGPDAQKENFLDRMQKYERVVKDLQQIVILLTRWGEGDQLTILEKVFNRITELAAYYGYIRTLIPGTSGQCNGIIRTA